jgi:hypothetical protein
MSAYASSGHPGNRGHWGLTRCSTFTDQNAGCASYSLPVSIIDNIERRNASANDVGDRCGVQCIH